jgi:predicted tellurium resistance membrane protein TerC
MMDLVAWGQETLNWAFFLGIINIVIIDLILAGDNAVVIAMAVRSLPRRQRRWGIILGAGAAVLLRVVLTFFVAQLLGIQFVKLVGGVLIAWRSSCSLKGHRSNLTRMPRACCRPCGLSSWPTSP